MRFFNIVAAFSFVLYANATFLHKRDIQAVINDLTNVNTQGQTVVSSLESYQASEGYAMALTIQGQITTLFNYMSTDETDTCTLTNVSEDEVNEIIAEVGVVTPTIYDILDLLQSKQSVFDTGIIASLFKQDAEELCDKYQGMFTCLVSNTPSDAQTELQGYSTTIVNKCNIVIPLYS